MPKGKHAYAEVNHGRWIVNCPVCPNAFLESLAPDECPNCHTAIQVIAPSEKDRMKIGEALMRRPDETTRNWAPHESVKDLIAENIAHGVDDA